MVPSSVIIHSRLFSRHFLVDLSDALSCQYIHVSIQKNALQAKAVFRKSTWRELKIWLDLLHFYKPGKSGETTHLVGMSSGRSAWYIDQFDMFQSYARFGFEIFIPGDGSIYNVASRSTFIQTYMSNLQH